MHSDKITCAHSKKATISLKAKDTGLRKKQTCQRLDLEYLTSRLRENKFLLCQTLSLWYFIMAALAN